MRSDLESILPDHWDMPESIIRRLGVVGGKQRAMDEDGHLLLIVHHPPKPEDDEIRHAALFWCDPDGNWDSHPRPGGLEALEHHLNEYRQEIHALDEAVESAKTSRDYFEVMKRTNPLHRATRNQLAALQEARDARPDERHLIALRDQAVELERAIELVAEDAKSGMDFTIAESAEQQARFSYEAGVEARRLNRLVAFFFPIATLVAIFGINPPEEILQLHSFWIVLAFGIVAGCLVLTTLSWRMRRK